MCFQRIADFFTNIRFGCFLSNRKPGPISGFEVASAILDERPHRVEAIGFGLFVQPRKYFGIVIDRNFRHTEKKISLK